LCDLAVDPEKQKNHEFETLSHGWAIGTDGWRNALAREWAHEAVSPDIEAVQLKEMKETRWSKRLDDLLARTGLTIHDVAQSRKSASWKVELAVILRKEEGAAIGWIAGALAMGKPSSLRNYLYRRAPSQM
jgi:putative transposase